MGRGTPRAGAAGGSDFVGRATELRELGDAVQRAHGGRGSVALVAGEPGIGKTRLAEETAALASARGFAVLWGACSADSGAPPLWPWVQPIRTWLRQRDAGPLLERLPGVRADLARLVPDAVPGGTEPDRGLEPDGARFRQFDSMATFLEEAAREQPLLVVVDDLQWADPSSLRFLEFLAGRLRESPVLALGLYRDVELPADHPLVRLLSGTGRPLLHLTLADLDRDGVADLVTLAAQRDVGADVGDAVFRVAGGNPFYVREVVRLLESQSRLDTFREDGQLPLVPSGARGVVRRRVSGLTAACERVLAAAAVLGPEFDVTLLGAVSGLPPAALRDALDEARAARLVATEPAMPGRYRFTHAIVRDVIYEDLGGERRGTLHERAAAALEDEHAADLDSAAAEIARHHLETDPHRAVPYLERSGRRALAMLGYEEAAAAFRRALDVADRIPGDGAVRLRLLLALGDALGRAGDTDGSRGVFTDAAAAARRTGDGVALATAALGYGSRRQFAGIAGADRRLAALLRDALALLPEAASQLRVDLLSRLASELAYVDRAEATALLSAASEIAAATADPGARAGVLMLERFLLHGSPQPSARAARNEEAARLAAAAGDHATHLDARVQLAVDLLEQGRLAEFDAMAVAFDADATSLHLTAYRWYPSLWRAMRALMAGDVAGAEQLAGEALERGAGFGQIAVDHFGMQLLQIRREQGRLSEMVELLRGASAQNPHVPAYRCALVRVLAELGEPAAATAELEGLAADGFGAVPRDYNWTVSMAMLADACAYLGDAGRAAQLLELYRPWAGLHVFVGQGALWLGPVDHYLGLCAATAGRADAAAGHLRAAAEASRKLGALPFLARTNVELAAATERVTPGAGEAGALLDEAGRIAAALGLPRLLARAGAPAVAATGDGGPAEAPNVFRRDGELWRMVFRGEASTVRDSKGVRDIAALLASPGHAVHVSELVAATDGSAAAGASGTSGDEILDARAREAYRRRIVELQADLDDAEGANDIGRADRAREELDVLTDELAAALGLGGRHRSFAGDPSERARKSVLERIRRALSAIDRQHPALAGHLRHSIRTGAFCAYEPEQPTSWSL